MPLDPKNIQKFVHDTAKPIRNMRDCLEFMETNPEILSEERRKDFKESLEHVIMALDDLNAAYATCEIPELHKWENADWKGLVDKHVAALAGKISLPFDYKITGDSFIGRCEKKLAEYALENMGWFATHYSNRLMGIELASNSGDARLTYHIETAIEPGSDFVQVKPFAALSETSLTLKNNTALVLSTVRKIMELHGGAFSIRSKGSNSTLQLSWMLTPN